MSTQPIDKHLPAKPPVSLQKIEANRRNALKSTGPKTPRGKKYSSRNAVKHGLLNKHLSPLTMLHGENFNEFLEYREKARQVYKPVGVEEEFEVDVIVRCRLKQHRAARYEDAELIQAQSTCYLEFAGPASDRRFCDSLPRMLLLKTAEKEVLAVGVLSGERKNEISAADYDLDQAWRVLEDTVRERIRQEQIVVITGSSGGKKTPISVSTVEVRKELCASLGPDVDDSSVITLATIRLAIEYVKSNYFAGIEMVIPSEFDRLAVPNADALDKLIRYEAWIEKSLANAIARLDWLQRNRMKGQSTGDGASDPVN